MKYKIKEGQLKKIVFEEYNKLIKEGYVPSSAFNNFAKADESGILVANEKLSDFISYVENTPGVFENLPPMLKEMYQDAKNYFNAYPHLDKNQKPMKENITGIPSVDRFTPYTPEEKARNFEYLRTGFGRSPEERNPSYAAAKKAAEERRKQKETQKQSGEVSETIRYGAERMAADNNYRMRWNEKYLQPLLDKCDAILNGSEKDSVQEIVDLYKRLNTIKSSNPIRYDVRLIELQDEINNRLEKLVEFIRQMMTNRPNESKKRVKKSEIVEAIKDVLSEWKKSINEDGYSYNGIEQQAQYRKMGEDLMAQQDKEKNYKKNVVLFKRAFNKVYKEFTIIGTLKRKSEEAKRIFNFLPFFEFVKETEGDTLYSPIWEKYGGEYLEMANTYLESNIIKLRRKMSI